MRRWVSLAAFIYLLFPLFAQAETLNLEGCIREALEKSPYLARYKEEFLAEKPRMMEEFSGFLPSIYLESSITRYMTQRLPPVYERYKGVRLEYNLFEGGQTLFRYLGAREGVREYAARYREAVIETAYRVVVAFYNALEKRGLWKASIDDLKDAQVNLDTASARFKEGLAPYADVIKARARVAGSKFKVNERQSRYWISMGNLNMEMGRALPSSLEIQGKLEAEAYPVDFESAKSEALKKSPLLWEIRSNVQKKRYKKREVIGEFLPQVDFNWTYGRKHISSTWDNESYNDWRWQLTFSLPVFTGFSSRARLKREGALLRSLEFQEKRRKLEVIQSVWEAYQDLKKSESNVLQAEAYQKDALHDLNVTRGRYKEGLASMVDLLDAQATLSEARAQYITSLAGLEESLAALEKAIGEVPYLERPK